MKDDLFELAKTQARKDGKNIGTAARELGAVPTGGDVPTRTAEAQRLADRAMSVLRDEVGLLARMRVEFAAEKRHGAPAASMPRLDAMAARLEGMTRLALLLELIAPAEARAIWTEARGSGVHDRRAGRDTLVAETQVRTVGEESHGSTEGEH